MDFAFYSFFQESLNEAQQQDRLGIQQFTRPLYGAHYLASGGLEAARRAADEQGSRIRPDGQLLIYLMAREFIAKPGIAVREIPEPDLDELLASDMQTLVAGSEGEEEISGHALMLAASSRWESLRSASLEFWGP